MKVYLYAELGAAALAALGWYTFDQRTTGAANERAKQEKANAEFRVRAQKGAVDFDTCDAAGGLYDFRTRACELQ